MNKGFEKLKNIEINKSRNTCLLEATNTYKYLNTYSCNYLIVYFRICSYNAVYSSIINLNNQVMKKLFTLLLCFISTISVYSQLGDSIKFTDCHRFNSFMKDTNSTNGLMTYAREIHPNGTLVFNFDVSIGLNVEQDLYPLLKLDTFYTFTKTMEIPSRSNDEKVTERYQQFYKGILVEGGGYSLRRPIADDAPIDPCFGLYSLTPYLGTNIDIDIIPNYDDEQAIEALELELDTTLASVDTVVLVISPNL